MKLRNLTALITGASQGLGRTIAEEFVREGAHVAICARDGALINAAGKDLERLRQGEQRVLACACNVSFVEQVEELFSTVERQFGGVDVLVNNAGVYGPKGPSETVDFASWRHAIEINLFGTLLPARFAIPHMKQKRRGKIINLSGGGATSPMPNISAYAASKAAVVRLTETLAEELRDFSIDVNAVAPGALNTRLLNEILEAGPQVVGGAFFEKALKQRDSGGAPLEKAARLCAYLASSESDGITGKLISAQWDPWENLHKFRAQLAKSDIYTLRRIVPEDRGLKW
jgi:NAD(P)-dependent dehydrogenase (short-subunit alcohol dehydrogenase family)